MRFEGIKTEPDPVETADVNDGQHGAIPPESKFFHALNTLLKVRTNERE